MTKYEELRRKTSEIAAKAPIVGEQRLAQETAIANERRAWLELLETLVDAVKPALHAITSRLTFLDMAGESQKVIQGVAVVRTPGDDTGLYITSDADWLHRHLGTLGDDIPWYQHNVLSNEQVLEEFDVNAIASRLSDLLDQQLEGASKIRTESANKKAGKLRAVATLLEDEKQPRVKKKPKKDGTETVYRVLVRADDAEAAQRLGLRVGSEKPRSSAAYRVGRTLNVPPLKSNSSRDVDGSAGGGGQGTKPTLEDLRAMEERVTSPEPASPGRPVFLRRKP